MIRKDRPFSVLEFSRRIPVTLLGCELFVATAEDTIIAKLDWARESLSERQLRDVASILAVSEAQLEHEYIEHWITELDLLEVWNKAKQTTSNGSK